VKYLKDCVPFALAFEEAHVMRGRPLAVRWTGLMAAGAGVSLALLLAGGPAVRAGEPKETPKKKEVGKEPPADKEGAEPDAKARIKKLQRDLEKARRGMRKAEAEMRRAQRELARAMQKMMREAGQPPVGGPFPPRPGGYPRPFPGAPGPQGRIRLGVLPTPLSPELRAQLDLPEGKGLLVGAVLPGSPAARAGLKRYDVLVEVNGKEVPSSGDALRALLADVKPGTAVDLVVFRKGKRHTIKGLNLSGGKRGRPGEAAPPKGGEARPPAAAAPGLLRFRLADPAVRE
jgi:hypothetical protein